MLTALIVFGFVSLCYADFGRDELEIRLNQLKDNIDTDMLDKFLDFADAFNRFSDYEIEDDTSLLQRFESFEAADAYIAERNEVGLPYTLGHTGFSDKTDDEKMDVIMDPSYFASDRFNPPQMPNYESSSDSSEEDDRQGGVCTNVSFTGDLSATSDWRDYDLGITNQHSCGSCWVFGNVGVMEVNRNMDTGIQQKLSEQFMLDCTPDEIGTCDGGEPVNALSWSYGEGGLELEDEYGDYIGWEKNCTYDVRDELYAQWPEGNLFCLENKTDEQLTLAVTAFDVGFGFYVYYDFYFYVDGIYTCTADSGSYLGGHWVSAIGVTEDYYIVKNSWGDDWGMDGYFLINHTAVETCDMSTFAFVSYLDLDDSPALTEDADGGLYIDADKVKQFRSAVRNGNINGHQRMTASRSVAALVTIYGMALVFMFIALYVIAVWISPKLAQKYYSGHRKGLMASFIGSGETQPLLQP